MLPQISDHIVILCFERQYPKQNSVIRLKSNILTPEFLGWLRYWLQPTVEKTEQQNLPEMLQNGLMGMRSCNSLCAYTAQKYSRRPENKKM